MDLVENKQLFWMQKKMDFRMEWIGQTRKQRIMD